MTKLNCKGRLKNYKTYQIIYFTVFVCYPKVRVIVKMLWQSKCIITYFKIESLLFQGCCNIKKLCRHQIIYFTIWVCYLKIKVIDKKL